MHLLRKIRVSADAERTRRSSLVSCLLSHPSCATLPVHEAFLSRQASQAFAQPCSTWYYITLQSFQVSLRPRNASHTGKVAEVPMLNVRCGTEHACTGEILSRKESRRHESCPRSHHRPRSVFFGARELQFCPCSTVSAPALLPIYLRGPAGRCCKTRVRARGRPEIQDRELLLTLGAVSAQGRTVTCATAPGVL